MAVFSGKNREPIPPAPWRKGASVLFFLYGAGTLAGQVLILREVLVLCQGQELKLALGMWCWLICTGIGSLMGGRLIAEVAIDLRRLSGFLAILGVLLPATVFTAMVLPTLASLPPGQSWTPGITLVLLLLLLAPFGLASGAFFPLACKTLRTTGPQTGGAGWVYALETLGAALGTAVVQILLVGRYTSLALSLGVGVVLTLSAVLFSRPCPRWGYLGYAVTLSLLMLSLLYYPYLEKAAARGALPQRSLLAMVDSPYARLTVTADNGQTSFFVNNVWQFTEPDPYHAENAVHLGLGQHRQPRRVLLLGGGVAGLAPEILKVKSVTAVEYVELDPELVLLVQRFLPKEREALFQDRRLQVVHEDARRYLARTDRVYDVILMNLPAPASAQLNRFYTREFFQLVARRLSPPGVFSFSLPGGEASLNPRRAAYLGVTFNTLRQVFPKVLVYPGEYSRFFATLTPGVLLQEPEDLLARLQERQLDLKYVREYYLLHELSPERREYLQAILGRLPVEINTDLNPKCYFYDLALTATKEGLPIADLLQGLKNLPGAFIWAGLLIMGFLLCLVVPRRPGPLYLSQVATMGLGTMALEIFTLIIYQVYWGALYRQLGLLIAAFMAGMGLGGLFGVALTVRRRAKAWHLAALQACLGVLALLTAGLFSGALKITWQFTEWPALAGYLLLLALAGAGGGAVFAVSAYLWQQSSPAMGWQDGALYAADLAGATLGTLGLSLVVIPVWGLLPSLWLTAAGHGWAVLAIFLSVKRV